LVWSQNAAAIALLDMAGSFVTTADGGAVTSGAAAVADASKPPNREAFYPGGPRAFDRQLGEVHCHPPRRDPGQSSSLGKNSPHALESRKEAHRRVFLKLGYRPPLGWVRSLAAARRPAPPRNIGRRPPLASRTTKQALFPMPRQQRFHRQVADLTRAYHRIPHSTKADGHDPHCREAGPFRVRLALLCRRQAG
jgi:hypothetical protein